jgi:DNA polymerase
MEREEHIEQLLRDIRGALACQQQSSIEQYPASAELSSFFESRRRSLPAKTMSPVTAVAVPLSTDEPAPVVQPRQQCDHAVLTEIATEVEVCQSCSLVEQRSRVVAGRVGASQIRLLIVGHWLSVTGEEPPHTVFGVEEDLMLGRMLSAIHLPMDEVMVCNVVKCAVATGTQPKPAHIDACSSYLRRQIVAAGPEVICTMGMVATRSLLQPSQPLSKIRGMFHSYKGTDGRETPLLATYHPGFLLQNSEMKNATWEDLQLIQRRLGLQ